MWWEQSIYDFMEQSINDLMEQSMCFSDVAIVFIKGNDYVIIKDEAVNKIKNADWSKKVDFCKMKKKI